MNRVHPHHPHHAHRWLRARQGFTLLEIMIVLLIVGILAGAFAFTGSRVLRRSAEHRTRAQLVSLAALVQQYRSVEGDFPRDTLPDGAGGSPHNANAEALFLAFFDAAYTGELPDQKWLVNTDNDQSRKPLSSLPSRELFEIGDAWGNPILYFDGVHYDSAETIVLAGPEGDTFEQTVRPRHNERTQGWEAPGAFQLISAGEDGEFGTADDLTSFDRG